MLTQRAIQAAKPGATLRDSKVVGLHVRVAPSGRARFYLSFRTRDGIERHPKLGDWPAISIEQARCAAGELLAIVATGRDPIAERTTARQSPTMAELCDQYLRCIESDPRGRKKPRSVHEDRRMVDRFVKPRLGARKVSAVAHGEIDDLHQSLSATPYQANRVLALLSRMFNLAEKWRSRELNSNPCRHVRRFKEEKRKRYLREVEAPRVAAVLERHASTRPQAVAFIYLLVLTGARPNEIANARREWIERVGDAGVLRLPDSKTGARPVYLPPSVMRLLDRTPQASGTLTGIKSPKALWSKIRVEAGAPDLRLYDMRHTFASAALAAGYNLSQIGELLGHASTQTTKRYAHLIESSAHSVAAGTSARLERMLTA